MKIKLVFCTPLKAKSLISWGDVGFFLSRYKKQSVHLCLMRIFFGLIIEITFEFNNEGQNIKDYKNTGGVNLKKSFQNDENRSHNWLKDSIPIDMIECSSGHSYWQRSEMIMIKLVSIVCTWFSLIIKNLQLFKVCNFRECIKVLQKQRVIGCNFVVDHDHRLKVPIQQMISKLRGRYDHSNHL